MIKTHQLKTKFCTIQFELPATVLKYHIQQLLPYHHCNDHKQCVSQLSDTQLIQAAFFGQLIEYVKNSRISIAYLTSNFPIITSSVVGKQFVLTFSFVHQTNLIPFIFAQVSSFFNKYQSFVFKSLQYNGCKQDRASIDSSIKQVICCVKIAVLSKLAVDVAKQLVPPVFAELSQVKSGKNAQFQIQDQDLKQYSKLQVKDLDLVCVQLLLSALNMLRIDFIMIDQSTLYIHTATFNAKCKQKCIQFIKRTTTKILAQKAKTYQQYVDKQGNIPIKPKFGTKVETKVVRSKSAKKGSAVEELQKQDDNNNRPKLLTKTEFNTKQQQELQYKVDTLVQIMFNSGSQLSDSIQSLTDKILKITTVDSTLEQISQEFKIIK